MPSKPPSSCRSLLALACWLLAAALGGAEGFDRALAPGTLDLDGKGIAPGTVIGIQSGTWSYLIIHDLVGTPDKPIIVANVGGLVRLANKDRGYALIVRSCRYVRVTGSGQPGLMYGIQAEALAEGMFAIHVNEKSSDVEVDHVEVTGAGYGGFDVKDDPRPDGSVNRGAFVMENIDLHHNFVHDTGGEGFYVGHSYYDGIGGKDGKPLLLPHVMKNLKVHHNHTLNTGCEGIQIGCAIGLDLHDNLVEKAGAHPWGEWQDNGMQVNAAGDVRIYRNTVIGAPGVGVVCGALEADYALSFHHNVLVGNRRSGLYVGGTKGASARLFSNTVVVNKGAGLAIADPGIGESLVMNNLMVANESNACGGPGKCTVGGNLELADVAAACFKNPAANDYDLRPESPAIGRGKGAPEVIADLDLAGRDLTKATAVDVGAYWPSAPMGKAAREAKGAKKAEEKAPEAKAPEAKPAPPPVARPTAARWRPVLEPALTAQLAKHRRVHFSSTLFGGQGAEVTAFADGLMQLESGGSGIGLKLEQMSLDDAAALAMALVDLDRYDTALRALAAELLIALGRADDAQRYQRPPEP